MKHRTLRCAAETLVLLLIAAMAVFLAAGLHQRAPDGALSTLSTGWYQLTDGVRREVTLPAALETGPGQTITLYNDTLTDSDGGKVLSARGVEYGIEIRAGETLLYRYEDNAFPKNTQMKGRLWADTELPYGIGGQTLSLTFTELPGRMCRIDAPVLGSMPAVTGRHIQSSLFSAGMILVMLVLAVLALLIFLYMSFYGIRERRFLDTAVFLLLCSLWCLTDSGLYQLYGADTAAGSVVSFYAFMTMAIPMVHFVRNTVSGRLRLVPDVLIAAANSFTGSVLAADYTEKQAASMIMPNGLLAYRRTMTGAELTETVRAFVEGSEDGFTPFNRGSLPAVSGIAIEVKEENGGFALTGVTRDGKPLPGDETVTVTCLATAKQMAPLLADDSRPFKGGDAKVRDTWSAYAAGGSAALAEPEHYITLR